MVICSRCKENKDDSDFHYRRDKNRLSYHCKTCQRQYNKNHYKNNKYYYAHRNKKRKTQLRAWLKQYKSNLYCGVCGESNVACLDFHHKDSNNKKYNIAQMHNSAYSKKTILEEINKCKILCSNCHRKLHWSTSVSDSTALYERAGGWCNSNVDYLTIGMIV